MNYESFRKIEAWFYILVCLLEHDTENTQFFVNISNMVMINPKTVFWKCKENKIKWQDFPIKKKAASRSYETDYAGKEKKVIWAYHVWQVLFI
jgi:hypothetical protein